MIRAAIVEDDPVDQAKIKEYLQRFARENGCEIRATAFSDGAQIAMDYTPQWDILFLDIEMPGMDGLRTARDIRERDENVLLMYITNLARYAIKGYEVGALDFVLKPVTYQQFEMKMHKVVRALRLQEHIYLMISSKDGSIRLSLDEILFVEVRNHHLFIRTLDEEHMVFETLSHFEERLPQGRFARCSQSYLVNLQHVTRISGSEVEVSGIKLPISRTRKNAFNMKVSDYFGGRMR